MKCLLPSLLFAVPVWAQIPDDTLTLDQGQGTLITLSRPADTLFVADPRIADVQTKGAQAIFLFAKSPGQTTLYAIDAQHRVLLDRRIVVGRDLTALNALLAKLYPGGGVRAQPIGNAVLLTGSVATPGDAEDAKQIARASAGSDALLINHLQVTASTQVNLRVRIAEVDHSVIKELGLNWDVVTHPGSFVFGVAAGNQVLDSSPYSTAAAAGGAILTRNTGAAGTTTDSIVAGVKSGSTLIDSVIDALDQNGLVKTLAEPNLTTTSGQTASFLAGGEFPIFIPGGSLGQATVEFKQYGVSLAFTPVVLPGGRISLRVRPEVSALSSQGAVEISGTSIPSLTMRRADTTVELGSGESFAIGGLLQSSITNSANQLPGLGSLPVLGPLFRSTQFQNNESELVIIVTPYLVQASGPPLATPTDGYTPPNDKQLFLDGRDSGDDHGGFVLGDQP